MLLEVKNLHIKYGDIHAIKGVSFYVQQGELVTIIGANGAGKTTILNTIMGIIHLFKGNIIYKGVDITNIPSYKRAHMGIRIVPERGRLFPNLTVKENIQIGAYKIKDKAKINNKMQWIYKMFPILKERQNQKASTLSGGEQQQLAIARALISDPMLLLVDEVSMGLMPKLVDSVFDMLKKLNKEGLTILLVEQNATKSLSIADRGYVLETGYLVKEGDAKSLLNDKEVKEAYLGG